MAQEGLAGWQVKPGEAYAWLEQKTITFDFKGCAGNHALFLHEVAHALHPYPEGEQRNHYHGGHWAAKYGELVNKYLIPREARSHGVPYALRQQ